MKSIRQRSTDGIEWWQIGPHRLVCGDSHRPEVVRLATDGRAPGVTVIDPPFDCTDRWIMHLADPSIVFGTGRMLRLIPDKLWRFERVILKPLGHRCPTTHIVHRHALVAQVGSSRRLPTGREAVSSVVQPARPGWHSHEKPVVVLLQHLTLWTPEWELVLDPYAGSGSTMVAAEIIGRSAAAIELDRETCLRAVARMTQLLKEQEH